MQTARLFAGLALCGGSDSARRNFYVANHDLPGFRVTLRETLRAISFAYAAL